MSLTRIENQAVKLYTPSETTFNEVDSKCLWLEKYFQKVMCTDVTQIVMQSQAETETNLSPDPDVATDVVAINTGTSVNKLIDADADFISSGVNTEMTVRNTTTDASASVVSVDGATQLTLSDDIFTSLFDDYSISYYELEGETEVGTNEITKNTGGTGTITQPDLLTVGEFYSYSFDISSYSFDSPSDTITVLIGGQIAATLTDEDDPQGTITIYGEAGSNTDISLEFTDGVSADVSGFNLYSVAKPVFQIVNCDTDEVVYNSVASDVVASFESAQVMLNVDWSNLMDGYDCNCGCYRIEILADEPYADVLFRTDCFEMCDTFDCSVKLSGTNLDNAFGIDFIGLAYTPFVRISGDLEVAEYKGDKENEENSNGVTTTLYFKSELERNLFIYAQPEHIHNFLRLLIGYDTFEVDDVAYIAKEASYSPENERISGKLLSLYNASTKLRLKNDLNENKYC